MDIIDRLETASELTVSLRQPSGLGSGIWGLGRFGTRDSESGIRENMQRRSGAGFSLIELSTAVFILTVGVLGVMTMFFYGLDKVRNINEARIAVRAVQNELETRRALPFQQLVPGTSAFLSKTPELDRLLNVSTTVVIADDASVAPGRLRRVTATVAWTGEHGRHIEKHMSILAADKGR